MGTVGVPVKLVHEAIGHVVTVELTSGTIYRGKLHDAEDNLNLQMKDIIATYRDGSQQRLEHAYVRGSAVRFVQVPDMLKRAPMFKNIGPGGISRGPGLGMVRGGRGKS